MNKSEESQTRKQSRATKFVKRSANTTSSSVPELSVVGETDDSEEHPIEPENDNNQPQKTTSKNSRMATSSDKSVNRSELPKKELGHRVHDDIHSRIDEVHHMRRKSGKKSTLAGIADEALHLGLLVIEKNMSKSPKP